MKWIVQENLFKEEKFNAMISALKSENIEHQIIKVIPFSQQTIPEIPENEKCFAYGSTSLIRIAQERKWSPGVFLNENFSHEKWVQHWGKDCLNYGAEIQKFGNASFEGVKFVRPIDDLKAFSGQIIDGKRYEFWKERCVQHHTLLQSDQKIIIAEPKHVLKEYRVFVVDKHPVTGSQYAEDGEIKLGELCPYVRLFAKRMCDIWSPHDAFVLDIAKTPQGHKIIEVNCINASGLYDCDVLSFVRSINNMRVWRRR